MTPEPGGVERGRRRWRPPWRWLSQGGRLSRRMYEWRRVVASVPSTPLLPMHDILIIGGGFAGVWTALGAAAARRELRAHGARLRIALVTREPYLTIRPRLYESNPEHARVPLAELLEAAGVELVVGDVDRIDTNARTVAAKTPTRLSTHRYDRLVLAAGSRLRRPPARGADAHTFNVDTYAAAMALERHLRSLADGRDRPGRFTAVVVGAGFAGLEVATTIVGRLRSIASQ